MITKNTPLKKSQIARMNRKIKFYNCQEGELEIFNLMFDAKMFDVIKTDEELARRNYAIGRLTELGFNQEDKIRKIIHELLSMPAVLDEDGKKIVDDTGETNGND